MKLNNAKLKTVVNIIVMNVIKNYKMRIITHVHIVKNTIINYLKLLHKLKKTRLKIY